MKACALLAICLTFGLLAGTAGADPKEAPKPPGTPKAEVAPAPQDPAKSDMAAQRAKYTKLAIEIMERALTAAAKPGVDCTKVITPEVNAAWKFLPLPPKDLVTKHLDAFVALARCAEKVGYYRLEVDLGRTFGDYKLGHAELVARGLFGQKDYKDAARVLDGMLKATPKDANALLTAAKVTCKLDAWKPCAGYADQARKNASSLAGSERSAVEVRALKYAARAALHLGALDKAQQFATQSQKLGGDRDDLTELADMITAAKINHALVEPEYDHELPIGLYHLYGNMKGTGSLISLGVTNLGAGAAQFKAEVAIDGITQKAVQTVSIDKAKTKILTVTPPLLATLDVATIRAASALQISVKVTALTGASQKVVYEQTLPINVLPRDYLQLGRLGSGDSGDRAQHWTLGAWVTPNSKAIDGFLQKAKLRAPNHTFDGAQGDTFPQVKAIFDELKAQGMSYVMDPTVLSNESFGQRTRLPFEVLKSTNAQCLEGTLLYASLLEAIGLRPVMQMVKGHIFVGWHAADKDLFKAKLPDGMYFLETTATHDATFEQAVGYALHERIEHKKDREFDFIELEALRRMGVTPQPTE